MFRELDDPSPHLRVGFLRMPLMLRMVLILAPLLLASSGDQQHAPPQDPGRLAMEVDPFLFFAVLKGLFADGVEDGIVRKVLEADDKVPGKYANFVYTGPICRPSIEGSRSAASRSPGLPTAERGT
jgi:hypothetical protein